MNPSLDAAPFVSEWICIDSDGTIFARTGKSEIGQGISTALAQIVASGLGVPLDQVRMAAPSTTVSPDEGFTAGSLSIQQSGSALHLAAGTARRVCMEAAERRLGGSVQLLEGRFTRGDASVTYAELAGDVELNIPVDLTDGGQVDKRDLIGDSVPRGDLPGKVLGAPSYIQDMRLPGMRFGRMVRPPFRGARLVRPPAAIDLPGDSTLVVDGSVVGVVASREIHAIAAAETVRELCEWTGQPPELDDASVPAFLTSAPTEDTSLSDGERGDGMAFRARYTRPFLEHASIGTSCAIASVTAEEIEVWTHTQGVYPLRRDIARALGRDASTVTVHHIEGAGCYGHNPADDVAYDAVLLARAVPGVPIHVTWTRTDELSWGPMAPAMVVDLEATTDADGALLSWAWDGYGNGHSSRPSTLPSPSLLAYADQAGGEEIPPSNDPPLAAGQGTGRNAIPAYRIPSVRATAHRLRQMPIRASAMRSLGAHMNVFAIESHIDDIARHHGMDPVEYRLRHLDDPRSRAVIERAAEMASWGGPLADNRGRGIGFARYKNSGAWCAVVAEIEAVNAIEVCHLWIAVDCGRIVNPDGVLNQIEGGAIQSVSWTLYERLRFAEGTILSSDWESYPILRFTQAPPVSTSLIDRPEQPWLGSGEAASGPTAAALGNALRDALGVRVQDLPLSPDHILAALEG